MNRLFIFKNAIAMFTLLFIYSCGGPTPTVTITSPRNDQKFYKDVDIPVDVIISDDKGKTTTVQLFADNKWADTLYKAPFKFSIPAEILEPGNHSIKVIAETKSGKQSELTRKIKIIDEKWQSDDFVSFRFGTVPPEWKLVGWEISSDGQDDKYCITTQGATINSVSTAKKCNKVAFYLKGYGEIQFCLNGGVYKTIPVRLGEGHDEVYLDMPWTRFEFSFPSEIYNISWKNIPSVSTGIVGLDNIIFYNEKE